jgi:hypothetical protein
MTDTTTAPRLAWRRVDGRYTTAAPMAGEADQFRADIVRDDGRWFVQITTHGRALDNAHQRTLADARAHAQTVLNVVWVAAP